jgi:hypothetical protein
MWNVSTTSGGEETQYASRIEEINEEDKIQEVHPSQSISQINRETFGYLNLIFSSLALLQTIIGLPEYQSQQGRLGHLCSVGIQDDRRNQSERNYLILKANHIPGRINVAMDKLS